MTAATAASLAHERAVLGALAGELETLSERSAALQLLVTRVLSASATTTDALVDIQAADLVAQTLQELTRFLKRYLDQSATPEALRASISHVVLGELSNRLSTACLGGEAHAPPPSGVELF